MEGITLTTEQFEALLTRLGSPPNQSLITPEKPDEDELCRNYVADVLATASRSWFSPSGGKLAAIKKEVVEFLKERL